MANYYNGDNDGDGRHQNRRQEMALTLKCQENETNVWLVI